MPRSKNKLKDMYAIAVLAMFELAKEAFFSTHDVNLQSSKTSKIRKRIICKVINIVKSHPSVKIKKGNV